MRIAVIGAHGQVGSEVVRAAHAAGIETIALEHSEIEITSEASVQRALKTLQAHDVVINTAAFHRTDECEAHIDRALAVNAVGAFRVALEAGQRGAAFVLLSSDFVFDGQKRSPYVENDAPNPINVYGASKRAGELLVASATARHYIARISSVFGVSGSSGKGGNFVESMIAKAKAGESPRVVDDIVMSPTSARDAAHLLVELLRRRAPFGPYHLSNSGQCSWFEFANAILELLDAGVRATPIKTSELVATAPRPSYSALASVELPKLGLHARPWREALSDYLLDKGHLVRS